MKIGRNEKCPCGSGKKYKKCHADSDSKKPSSTFTSIPPDLGQRVTDQIQKQSIWESRYGKGSSIITLEHKGTRFVAVGSRLHYSTSWKTFTDFLIAFLPNTLGADWGNAELKKPFEERHSILQWYGGLCQWQRDPINPQKEGGLNSGIANGIVAGYLALSYDLFTVAKNIQLSERLLQRLKSKDHFPGARHELYVAATCLRAGFNITFEDETDRAKKHPEFIAIHEETGQKIAVEAKCRNRAGVLGQKGILEPAQNKVDVERLLNDAVKKDFKMPSVIFIEMNQPSFTKALVDDNGSSSFGMKFGDLLERVRERTEDKKDPFNAVIFTNHPYHYGAEKEPEPAKNILCAVPTYPKYPLQKKQAIIELVQTARQSIKLPAEFPVTEGA